MCIRDSSRFDSPVLDHRASRIDRLSQLDAAAFLRLWLGRRCALDTAHRRLYLAARALAVLAKRLEQALDIALARPPAAGGSDQVAPGDVAHDDATLEQTPYHRGGITIRPPADESSLAGRGDDLEAFGQRLAAELAHPVSYTHLRAHETVLDLVCR